MLDGIDQNGAVAIKMKWVRPDGSDVLAQQKLDGKLLGAGQNLAKKSLAFSILNQKFLCDFAKQTLLGGIAVFNSHCFEIDVDGVAEIF